MIWSGIAAAAVVLALVLALPFLASTRLVGERIAEEIRESTGLDVTIAGAPVISVWPDLQANLANVTLSQPDGSATLTAERVEIELSALSALSGSVDFSHARFIRPTLRVKADAELSGLPEDGRVGIAVKEARDIVAEDRLSPDRSRLSEDEFGVIQFSQGRVIRMSGDSEEEIASDLDGKFEWKTLRGNAKFRVKGTVRGEPINLNFGTNSGLLLLGGAATQVTLDFKSAPANIAFDGNASLGDVVYADGWTSMSAPSVRRMLEWSTTTAPADSPALGSVAVAGKIIGDPARVRLEDAVVTLDGRAGRGSLDVTLSGKRPLVAGTLAFETLDLGGFLKAFTPLDATAGNGLGTIDADFASRLNLDLRLSAAQATVGALALTDLAATTRVEETFAAFDVSDASALGGDIQAGLRFDRKNDAVHAELRLLASDIDGAALGTASGLAIVPQAAGSLSLILKGDGESWQALLAQANGSFSARFGPGTLSSIDVDGLVSKARAGAPFSLADVAGTSQVNGLDVKATVAKGRATIERAEVRSLSNSIAVTGGVGLGNGMLALRGTTEPPAQAAAGSSDTPASTTFLIDGPWNTATVNPAAVTIAD